MLLRDREVLKVEEQRSSLKPQAGDEVSNARAWCKQQRECSS